MWNCLFFFFQPKSKSFHFCQFFLFPFFWLRSCLSVFRSFHQRHSIWKRHLLQGRKMDILHLIRIYFLSFRRYMLCSVRSIIFLKWKIFLSSLGIKPWLGPLKVWFRLLGCLYILDAWMCTFKAWSTIDKEESLACQITSPFNKKIGCFWKAIFNFYWQCFE